MVNQIGTNLGNQTDTLATTTIASPSLNLGQINSEISSTGPATISDLYQALQTTNNEISQVLKSFKQALKSSKNTDQTNETIVRFMEQFYALRDLLQDHLKIYKD